MIGRSAAEDQAYANGLAEGMKRAKMAKMHEFVCAACEFSFEEPHHEGCPSCGHPMSSAPTLLRIPKHFNSVDEVLTTAMKLELSNVVVISERADGSIVLIGTDMALSETNWLLDRAKLQVHHG